MHFTTAASLILTAMTPLSSAIAGCDNVGNNAVPVWEVWANGVDDIPGKCGGLWDNLNGFGGCIKSHTYCGGSYKYLKLKFTGTAGCNAGVVESAWYSATKNKFGAINC